MPESASMQPETDSMKQEIAPGSLISVTLARIENQVQAENFMRELGKVMAQLKQKPDGLVHTEFFTGRGEDGKVSKYATVTAWRSQEDMDAFRDTGSHGEAKKMEASLRGDVSFATWESTGDDLPTSIGEIEGKIAASPKR